jgi:hypothetical protein
MHDGPRRRLQHRPHRISTTSGDSSPFSAALDSPRLRALYQQWLIDPERAIDQAQSRALAIALERGTGRIECVDLTRQYLHLSPLVDIG